MGKKKIIKTANSYVLKSLKIFNTILFQNVRMLFSKAIKTMQIVSNFDSKHRCLSKSNTRGLLRVILFNSLQIHKHHDLSFLFWISCQYRTHHMQPGVPLRSGMSGEMAWPP